jgi:hypothetical protein
LLLQQYFHNAEAVDEDLVLSIFRSGCHVAGCLQYGLGQYIEAVGDAVSELAEETEEELED